MVRKHRTKESTNKKNIPDGVWNFLLTRYFRPLSGPRVDSACNWNEYQGPSLERRRLGLTILPPLYTDCLKILGAWTTWRPRGLPRPVQDSLASYVYGIWYALDSRGSPITGCGAYKIKPLCSKKSANFVTSWATISCWRSNLITAWTVTGM
jgi:hypothetical protein